MSEQLVEMSNGPLDTGTLTVTKYSCNANVVDRKLATSRKSVQITMRPMNCLDTQTYHLTYNQALVLADAIKQGLE